MSFMSLNVRIETKCHQATVNSVLTLVAHICLQDMYCYNLLLVNDTGVLYFPI